MNDTMLRCIGTISVVTGHVRGEGGCPFAPGETVGEDVPTRDDGAWRNGAAYVTTASGEVLRLYTVCTTCRRAAVSDHPTAYGERDSQGRLPTASVAMWRALRTAGCTHDPHAARARRNAS